MKQVFWLVIGAVFYFSSLHANSVDRRFSVGLHGFESMIGNYGLTSSLRVSRHVSITMPVEFYSFAHSLPGRLAFSAAENLASSNGIDNTPKLSMFHLRAGLGARIFFTPTALGNGFYVEPAIYGGWIRASNFSEVEFDSQREVINSMITTLYRELPDSDHFALTPQLNIGYQWVTDFGLLFQMAAYGNYVYAPKVDSIFSASDRFFASSAIGSGVKSQVPQNALEMFRAFGTQMDGWHAGVAMNVGFAF